MPCDDGAARAAPAAMLVNRLTAAMATDDIHFMGALLRVGTATLAGPRAARLQSAGTGCKRPNTANHVATRNKKARRSPGFSSPCRPRLLLRLAELVRELVGVSADGVVEHDLLVVVLGNAQHVALAHVFEPGRLDLFLHERRIDAVQRVGF